MRVLWLVMMGPGLLFSSMVSGAPGKHHKRNPYGYYYNDPETSSKGPITPIGYNYGYVPSTGPAPEPTGKVWTPPVSGYVPPCSSGVPCPACPGGYYCPSTEVEGSPTKSLVIVPTCTSWKACPECRGGYKCWKPKPTATEAPIETTSATLTIIPTCYPWNYCYNCIGGYSCPQAPVVTTVVITAPKPIIYPTCSDYILCSTCSEGYICPFVTKGSGVSRNTEDLPSCVDFVPCQTCEFGFSCPTPTPTSSIIENSEVSRNAEYLPTCTDFRPCPTCSWGWDCPSSDPTNKTYTIVITQGTEYTTVTETIPVGYGGYDYGIYGTSQPPETTGIYDWIAYDQPTCTDYIVCPTCAQGYYCPEEPAPSAPVHYQTSNWGPKSPSTTHPLPSFYPPPPCDNYILCRGCFLGYYCPGSSQGTHTTSEYPVKFYESPPCDDYIVCPTCALGYHCPRKPSSGSQYTPTAPPSYFLPSCSDYIVCPSCPLGYYCPESTPISATDPKPTYNWIPYEQPTCPDYIVCPSCPLGYHCPTSTNIIEPTPKSYPTPTCKNYMICPSCPLGYYCPSQPETPSRSIYYTKSKGNDYSSTARTTYLPSTTYYIGLPSTTLIVAPTCSEYVLCPVCPGSYYCPSSSPTPTSSQSVLYYYPDPYSSDPTTTVPPCDVYVFCPECELGYSCLVRSTSSDPKPLRTYKTGGTANPPMSNPYPVYTSQSRTPTIDGTYVTGPESPKYGPASVPAPEVPTCAGYVLCPACPSGYYCASTVVPTAAPSTYYGVAPTGVVEPVYSTTIALPKYNIPPGCPDAAKTVTVTTTRDIFRIYNVCATDSYAISSSFAIPTVTITQCNSEIPSKYTPPPSSSDCSTCDPEGGFYPIQRPTDFDPPSSTNWGQGGPYFQNSAHPVAPTEPYQSEASQIRSSCSFRPCDRGYYCETCPHKWYCPTPTDRNPSDTPYPPNK